MRSGEQWVSVGVSEGVREGVINVLNGVIGPLMK